jgi:hypothetical protein
LRYGERTARGIAEGYATMLEERRRVTSNKRIMVGRNTMREVALLRPPATSASGEEDDKRREWPLAEWSREVAGLRARNETPAWRAAKALMSDKRLQPDPSSNAISIKIGRQLAVSHSITDSNFIRVVRGYEGCAKVELEEDTIRSRIPAPASVN